MGGFFKNTTLGDKIWGGDAFSPHDVMMPKFPHLYLFSSLNSLNQTSDVGNDIWICQCADVSNISAIRNRSQDTAHNFPGTCLRHIRHNIDMLGSGNLPNSCFYGFDNLIFDLFARSQAWFQSNVNIWNAPFNFVG